MIWPRRILGFLALFIGLTLIGWFIYNVFSPTPEFRSAFRSPLQLVIPIAFLYQGWRWIHCKGASIEDTRSDPSCPELSESVQRAKETLPYFLGQVEKNVDGSFVKFPLTSPQGSIEHIWGYVHSFRDGKFNVSLANKQVFVDEPAAGRQDVSVSEIEDWQIVYPDGRIKGAYSLIALFLYRENRRKKLSPKMRQQKPQLIDAQTE